MARIIATLIFGGFGLVLLYVGITQFVQQRRNLANAERVDATITESVVFTSTTRDTDQRLTSSNSTTSHRPDVKFRYVVAGTTYESDLLYPTKIVTAYASKAAAEEELAPFPLNAVVRAYVDPAHPELAFLVAEKTNGPIGFIIIGLLLPPLIWWLGKYI